MLKQSLWSRIVRSVVLALVLAAVASFVPTPYRLEAPGRASLASKFILIKDPRAKPVNGRFLMTTVLLEKATLMLCIYGLLDPQASLTIAKQGRAQEEAQAPNSGSFQMELSQYLAARVALQELGFKVEGKEVGLLVRAVKAYSPNLNILRPKDLIVAQGEHEPPTLKEFWQSVEGLGVDELLSVLVERDGRRVPLDLKVSHRQGKNSLDALLQPVYDSVVLPISIVFHENNVVGASAGLIFALEIYDELSSEDLAQGRTIAGTGTLNAFGTVGGIEGIRFKIVGAERAGASVFLMPRENWDEVKDMTTSMRLIPVDNFKDALRALRK